MDSNTSRRQSGASRARGAAHERSPDTITMRGAMSPNPRGDLESGAQTASPSNNLDQVREILFGAHYRDFERKLGRLEALVGSQSDELRTDTKSLVQVLEAHFKREIDAMNAQRESDRQAQMEAINGVARETREALAQIDQRIKKLEDGLARAQREFRQQILDEGKAYVEQTRRVREEVFTMLHRELAMYAGESPEAAPASGVVETARLPEARTGES
jgi:hypothetical protein